MNHLEMLFAQQKSFLLLALNCLVHIVNIATQPLNSALWCSGNPAWIAKTRTRFDSRTGYPCRVSRTCGSSPSAQWLLEFPWSRWPRCPLGPIGHSLCGEGCIEHRYSTNNRCFVVKWQTCLTHKKRGPCSMLAWVIPVEFREHVDPLLRPNNS